MSNPSTETAGSVLAVEVRANILSALQLAGAMKPKFFAVVKPEYVGGPRFIYTMTSIDQDGKVQLATFRCNAALVTLTSYENVRYWNARASAPAYAWTLW